jgi:hypothetical protein
MVLLHGESATKQLKRLLPIVLLAVLNGTG